MLIMRFVAAAIKSYHGKNAIVKLSNIEENKKLYEESTFANNWP